MNVTTEELKALAAEAVKYGLQHADADIVVSDIVMEALESSEEPDFGQLLDRVRIRAGSKKRNQRRNAKKFLSYTDNPDDQTPGEITCEQLDEIVKPSPLPTAADSDAFMAKFMTLAYTKDGELVLRSARLTQKQLAEQENCSQPTIARRLEKAIEAARAAFNGRK